LRSGIVEETIATMTRKHKTQVDELERQIQWFTENQELVADRDAKFRRQARRIEELDGELAKAHRELAKFQPAAGVSKNGSIGDPDRHTEHENGPPRRPRHQLRRRRFAPGRYRTRDRSHRLRGFRRRVGKGEFSIFNFRMAKSIDAVFIYSQQNPQSVAALVRAVRPTEAHVERIAALEARCRRLQDELDATDGEHERSLRALQQEHLKFKSNMERR